MEPTERQVMKRMDGDGPWLFGKNWLHKWVYLGHLDQVKGPNNSFFYFRRGVLMEIAWYLTYIHLDLVIHDDSGNCQTCSEETVADHHEKKHVTLWCWFDFTEVGISNESGSLCLACL